jgi:hypothetical protein
MPIAGRHLAYWQKLFENSITVIIYFIQHAAGNAIE